MFGNCLFIVQNTKKKGEIGYIFMKPLFTGCEEGLLDSSYFDNIDNDILNKLKNILKKKKYMISN
jgi:hypothetical protein